MRGEGGGFREYPPEPFFKVTIIKFRKQLALKDYLKYKK